FFYVGTVQPLDVIVIEDCFARLDGAKKRLHLIEQCALEHAGIGGGSVHVIFKNVPPSKNQIVESSQRYKFVYFGSAAFGAPPQANGSHLRERSDGRRESFPDCLNPGDKSGCYRAHAGNHDSQLALGRLNVAGALSIAPPRTNANPVACCPAIGLIAATIDLKTSKQRTSPIATATVFKYDKRPSFVLLCALCG